MQRNISHISVSIKNYPNNLVVSENCVNTHTHTQLDSCVTRELYDFFCKKELRGLLELRDESLELRGFTAICSKQKAVGNYSSLKTYHSNLALGSKLQAISNKLIAECYSKLITYHSIFALGNKLKAASHSKLITYHSKLAESLKLEAYCLYAALTLAFLALGCSPVLIILKLCVVYLGAGRFLCTDVRMYRCTDVSMYRCTNVRMYHCTLYTNTLYNCTSVHFTTIQQPLKTI